MFSPPKLRAGLCVFALAAFTNASLVAAGSFPVNVKVDASKSKGELRQIWRFFGADEPNYSAMPHGRRLHAQLGELAPNEVYFRTHNLLSTGDGTPALKWGSTNAYTEDENGNPVYDWTILDDIFDKMLARGVRPYAQIGFMPKALSTQPEPYQHSWTPRAEYDEIYTGWAYPPKDYEKWGELTYQWVKHCVERYGAEEVRQWYWQTWNEANIGYWRGTPEEFYKLHDYAIAGVRRALPDARVGGPDCAGSGGDWIRGFFEHVLRGKNFATGEVGTPVDFVSFHAKGSPQFVDDHVRMGISRQLRDIDSGFRNIASYPELKNTPIVIGESDPEGCAACQGDRLGYRNGTMYSSYTAASFARKQDLADRHGINFLGALTWAFEFEDQPYFAGFRALASGGIEKPVLNVFRMFSKMSGDRVEAVSDGQIPLDAIIRNGVRDRADVGVFASADEGKLCVMLWHYHDDDLPGDDAIATVNASGLPADGRPIRLRHFRIDEERSNAYSVWQKMGSPQELTDAQYTELEMAGKLAELEEPRLVAAKAGAAKLDVGLPRQAVSLLVFEW